MKTICLGKSTYARCFSANTKVILANGNSLTLKPLAEPFVKNEQFCGIEVISNQVKKRRRFLEKEIAREQETLESFTGKEDGMTIKAARLIVEFGISQFESEIAWLEQIEKNFR